MYLLSWENRKELLVAGMRAHRVKKVFSVVGRVLNVVVFAVLILSIAALVYLLFGSKKEGLPFLEDYKIFTVASGSMEKTIHVGSVVVVKRVEPDTLQAGDVISFLSNDPLFNGKVVTHRIEEVHNETILMFYTKGDANEDRDKTAALGSNVIGKVVLDIPYLGYVLNFMQTKNGVFFVALLPCLLILLLEVFGLVRNICEYVDEKKALESGMTPEEFQQQANPQESENGLKRTAKRRRLLSQAAKRVQLHGRPVTFKYYATVKTIPEAEKSGAHADGN